MRWPAFQPHPEADQLHQALQTLPDQQGTAQPSSDTEEARLLRRVNLTVPSERLKARGKNAMQIIGAAMRKLLPLVYGVLKSGKPFDPALAKKVPATP